MKKLYTQEDVEILCAPLPTVDTNTPATMPQSDRASLNPTMSTPYDTATNALVMGSAALTVSTKDAALA